MVKKSSVLIGCTDYGYCLGSDFGAGCGLNGDAKA